MFEEVMVPKFPNLMKTKNSEIHEAQQISHRKHEENYTKTQHNQMLKINDKKEIFKSEREKKDIRKGTKCIRFLTGNNTKEKKV